jgi:hypothetical protein
MRWLMRRSTHERLTADLELARDEALREIDRGLMPLVVEHVTDPPMVRIVWHSQPVLGGPLPPFSLVWPNEQYAWAGMERHTFDQLIRVLEVSMSRCQDS